MRTGKWVDWTLKDIKTVTEVEKHHTKIQEYRKKTKTRELAELKIDAPMPKRENSNKKIRTGNTA